MTKNELLSSFLTVKRIKKGGQKTVYKATSALWGTVALKIVPDTNDKRVLQEIEMLKSLDIENIPKIYESGIVFDEAINENVLFIVEQFIPGNSLRDWLQSGNKATLNAGYTLLHSLLSTEMLLEQKSILHRDINPNNIILGDDRKIYLIDFGIAKNLCGPSLTQTAAIHGPFTPGYAPHEQIANMKLKQDVRTDLFQIGTTVYEACTGKNPFIDTGDNVFEIVAKTATFQPTPLNLPGDTNWLFSAVVRMLMSKNQSQRPKSAKDAFRYLETIKPTLSFGG